MWKGELASSCRFRVQFEPEMAQIERLNIPKNTLRRAARPVSVGF
jgi:hypothetical protein